MQEYKWTYKSILEANLGSPFCLLIAINHLNHAQCTRNVELNHLIPFKHRVHLSLVWYLASAELNVNLRRPGPFQPLNSPYSSPFPGIPVHYCPWLTALWPSAHPGREDIREKPAAQQNHRSFTLCVLQAEHQGCRVSAQGHCCYFILALIV